jgi:hypothetical protein
MSSIASASIADLSHPLLDLHNQMRTETSLETARELLNDLTAAADANDVPLGLKVRLFAIAMLVLAVSLLGCLPILLMRPHPP